MIFVMLGCLVLHFVFVILSDQSYKARFWGICNDIVTVCGIGFFVSFFVFIVFALRIPIGDDELEYKKEIMEVVVMAADFEEMSEDNLKIVARNVAEVNQGLSWYREHQNTFWYYLVLNKPKDKTEIKVEDSRLLRAMKEIIDTKSG